MQNGTNVYHLTSVKRNTEIELKFHAFFLLGPACTHDVVLEMDSKCSGRRHCDVEVKDSSFESYVPCHKDLKSYLEASFNCIQGINL